MISATEWSVIQNQAQAAGVDRFMPKPLFPSALIECLNDCFHLPRSGEETVAKGKDMTGFFNGRTLLLAEDVAINREIVIELLNPTGLEIVCAENGNEAIAVFAANPATFDMIFMDIQMPEKDGYEATRQIRALNFPWARQIPILAMTANVFREDIQKCLDVGMDGHLGKPLNIDEVIEKLKTSLPRLEPDENRRQTIDASA